MAETRPYVQWELINNFMIDVFKAYGAMLRGAFGNAFYLNDTLKRATPIIMGGLAVCIAWRSGYEAMGGEGQMILGAFVSAIVAFYAPLPGVLRIIAAMLGASGLVFFCKRIENAVVLPLFEHLGLSLGKVSSHRELGLWKI